MSDETLFTARPAGDGTDAVVVLVDAATAVQLANLWERAHRTEVLSPAAHPLFYWDVAALKRAAADARALTGHGMPITYVPTDAPATPLLRVVGSVTS